MSIYEILVAASIPSAVVGFAIWWLQRRIAKAEKKREERENKLERDRFQYEMLLIKTLRSSVQLSKAVASAVEKIPDAHCNGDMHQALEAAGAAEQELNEYMTRISVSRIAS